MKSRHKDDKGENSFKLAKAKFILIKKDSIFWSKLENKKLLNIVQSVASKKKIVEKSKTSDKEPQKQLSNVEVKVKSIENKVKLNKEKSKTNEEEITVDVKTKLINDPSKIVKDLK